jgi:DNA-dependent RNA polymerase auxiliary subunit epsilon
VYLRKEATVLISTVIILSLMSILGCFMYKMMKNNNELGTLYKFDKDIYDLDKDEEEILKKFMEDLNKSKRDKLNSLDQENNSEDIFSQDFVEKIEDSSLEYHKNNNKVFLITNRDNEISRKREIIYILRDEKIILVPTYKFENNSV